MFLRLQVSFLFIPVCGNPADIVFITDSSYSIYPKWFYENQLGFLRDMVNEFNIKPDGSGTRIGVIVFGDADKTKIEFNLKVIFMYIIVVLLCEDTCTYVSRPSKFPRCHYFHFFQEAKFIPPKQNRTDTIPFHFYHSPI